jgi:uncharacterized protein with HEPN domain
MPETGKLFADARDYARRAARFVDDVDPEVFLADEMRMAAVCFCIIVIAEAFNQLGRQKAVLPDEIPMLQIKGMRNILVHSYWLIDERIVYNVARVYAPILADRLDRLIREGAQ